VVNDSYFVNSDESFLPLQSADEVYLHSPTPAHVEVTDCVMVNPDVHSSGHVVPYTHSFFEQLK